MSRSTAATRAATAASCTSRRCCARPTATARTRRAASCTAVAAVVQRCAERREFVHLLHREGEPALQLGIEVGLALQVDRHVQQRAGRRDLHAIRCRAWRRRARGGRAMPVRSARQTLRPSIDAERKTKLRRRLGDDGIELLGRANEIEVQARDRQRQAQYRDCRRDRRNRSSA